VLLEKNVEETRNLMKLAADVARRSRVDGVEDLPMIGG
jgi:hypothetical protein